MREEQLRATCSHDFLVIHTKDSNSFVLDVTYAQFGFDRYLYPLEEYFSSNLKPETWAQIDLFHQMPFEDKRRRVFRNREGTLLEVIVDNLISCIASSSIEEIEGWTTEQFEGLIRMAEIQYYPGVGEVHT
ncbi:hypothetical protein BU24DRAFT_458923 [Aaosphaeria arxii CBS 175.79]|uniref:Uncharacterized protein n=1 Tax=Aaosphaeria arxii CBS 175.79 TaxID=1450172 RepID=A0A6A5Y1Y7_9PLEO|nr:uncharacterized protein BU24DRAFT_458923 [Aaosphaeria arxii CBS 175.79]KAF2019223.1 hypothetical protein BU24DRAFT_458923 [Aaosphaeria arxii CBS 175.79]